VRDGGAVPQRRRAGHSRARAGNPVLFNLDVNIDKARKGTITIRANDKPSILAAKFAVDRKLSSAAERRLSDMIAENIERFHAMQRHAE
jgi:hypothetical protein